MTTTETMTAVVAEAVDATKVYGSGDTTVRALDGVDVRFRRGRFTAIMGPSGSGKSTLMHCVAGLDTLTSGQVFVDGVELGRLSDKELTRLRRERLGFVFQAYNLVPTLTAAENVTLPSALAGRRPDPEWLETVIDGPIVARTAGAVLGAPVRRLRGVPGALAQQNAMRNPRRTAATASALMVGVAVVTLFTVFAASLRASVDRAVTRTFAGDLAITTGSFGGGALSPQLTTALAGRPEVKAAAGLGRGVARVGGRDESITITDPHQAAKVLDLGVTSGSLQALGPASLAVSSETARSRHWSVGSVVPVTFTDGTTTDVTIGAVYGEDALVGGYLLPRATWAPHAVQDLDTAIFVSFADGVGTGPGRAAVEAVTDRFGHPDVLDRAGYVDQATTGVNLLLGLVYVMLALAIVIALMGIANTLSLSIHERTRELGLLRAVGATRATLRATVRWESVIIALFGAIGGLGVGLFLGWALVRYRADAVTQVFAAPVGQLAVVLVAGGVAGVMAGVRPARRASRLDVLAAIATE